MIYINLIFCFLFPVKLFLLFDKKVTQRMLENDKCKKNSLQRCYSRLQIFEVIVYALTWVGLYLYSVKQVFHLSKVYIPEGYRIGDLERRKDYLTSSQPWKDVHDFEWDLWLYWFYEMTVYAGVGHFIIMRICEQFKPEYRFHMSALYGIAFCIYFYGAKGLVILLAQSLLLFSISHQTKNVALTWCAAITLTLPLISTTTFDKLREMFDDNDLLTVMYVVMSTMCNLRYIAFSVEHCWSEQNMKASHNIKEEKHKSKAVKRDIDGNHQSEQKTFLGLTIDLILYQFYFPLLSGGPVLNYNKFAEQIQRPPVTWTFKFFLKYILGILRYIFWQFVVNFLLHFLYFSSINTNERLLNRVPLLTLCGLALCFVQFFCMKYMVMYGLPSRIALADNLDVPGASHCVSSKHRFTDMWKYFDRGLHFWLVRYIFVPLGGSKDGNGFVRNTINSLIPFAFVYIWHGARHEHLVWAGLNWFGIWIEKIADDLSKTNQIKALEAKYFSPSVSRRIRAAVSTPLFSLLIVSNLYFLAGITAGNIYMRRIYTEDFVSTLLIHLVLYLGAQTSMELTRFGF
ncbi:unnamed protein product [Clavelina lepadiformis]|uniref:Protein-cysteine N-palmitoyltransferase Rasp n=2 Tax=Clavelina lepadiformis TaxID=159417 RepID=A0ABP0F2J5_CLALP